MPKRTDTTERVFEYLKEYIEEHNKSPEMGEIKEHFGFSSMGTVYYHIKRLELESRIEVGCIRGMKKFSRITVKVTKMRNIDVFNAMSRDGQWNMIVSYFSDRASFDDFNLAALADDMLDWLYSQAE